MTILTPDERTAWTDAAPGTRLNRTDAGNGEHFARMYGDRLRYDHRRRVWLVWAGHWWRIDDIAQVRRLAKESARDRYGQATAIDDLDERKREAGFAIASENRQRLEAMLLAAQSEPPIADAGDRWDTDPWLLGAANGVVDLRTGRARPGAADDRITRHSDVAFDADADCPRWERFLDEVFCGDVALIEYISRAVGYSLTGDTTEQCVFMGVGSGSNGKSVFLTVLRALGGGYAVNTPFSTLEQSAKASIPNDLAALMGRRIVTASEVNEGTRLNEARLKAISGGDVITARFLHAEFFDFLPLLKLWLGVNHKPVVRDDSYGFWRRVRLVPFERRFTSDADPTLTERLREELPGVLAWAVRGAIAWRRDGLQEPATVRTATETYRTESDPLADFLDARCMTATGAQVGASAVYAAYRTWAAESALRDREVLSSKTFGSLLTSRFAKVKRSTGWHYQGIGLLADGPVVTGRDGS